MNGTYSPHGARRAAVFIPSVNTCSEPDLYRLAPDGLTLHFSRMLLTSGGMDGLRAMAGQLDRGLLEVRDVRPDVAAFHCTSAVLERGHQHARELAASIEAALGCPALVTMDLCVAALKEVGASRVSLITPYPAVMNEAEVRYLEREGISVGANVALDRVDDMASISPGEWLSRAIASVDPQSDGVFLSCTNIRVIEIVGRLEAELGLPVVTSNLAMSWGLRRALRLEVPLEGYGRLLAAGPRTATAKAATGSSGAHRCT